MAGDSAFDVVGVLIRDGNGNVIGPVTIIIQQSLMFCLRSARKFLIFLNLFSFVIMALNFESNLGNLLD